VFRSRSPHARPLRYYVYISDTKLDMLFEQIDRGVLKRISAEVKVDIKLASLTLREAPNPGPTRSAKLQVVERFIEAHHKVGTVQEPGREYFRGQMEMQWGWAGDDAVWFQGGNEERSHYRQYLGLGGSRHHVLGERPPSIRRSRSVWPYIMNVLEELDRENPWIRPELPHNWADLVDVGPGSKPVPGFGKIIEHRELELRELGSGFPKQWVDFLAIPLVETQLDNVHIVIGTPLYVAMAR
jgi:hypothetical protein